MTRPSMTKGSTRSADVGPRANGTNIGGPANWEEFTQWQWFTIKNTPTQYPF